MAGLQNVYSGDTSVSDSQYRENGDLKSKKALFFLKLQEKKRDS